MSTIRNIIIPLIVVAIITVISIAIISNYVVADVNSYLNDRTQSELLTNNTEIAARDLSQQMAMAQHSYYQLWINTAALLISTIGMALLFYSLYQTRQAIEDNKNIGIAQSCAFIHAEKVEPSKIEQEGYLLHVKNTGSSPALDINISFFIQSTNPPLSEKFVFPEDNKSYLGSVAAGDTRPFVIRTNFMELFEGFGPGQNTVLSGTISYSDIFDTRYKSQFAFYRSSKCDNEWLLPAIGLAIHKKIDSKS